MTSSWFSAGCWGLLSGSALLVGGALGWMFNVPRRVTGLVMAFGVGVLLSAVSFELINKALRFAGLEYAALGALVGALVYAAANYALSHRGARHRKRSVGPGESAFDAEEPLRQLSEGEQSGSGLAIALGALLDGIPESAVLGLGMAQGGAVSTAAVVAFFLSNVPEGMSSTVGMRKSGRSKVFVTLVWSAITIVSGASAAIGFAAGSALGREFIASTMAFAGGAILAMVADTMAPEAYDNAHHLTGITTVLGFLCAFALSRAG